MKNSQWAIAVLAVALLFPSCTSLDDLIRQDRLNEAAESLDKLPAAQRADGLVKLAGVYARRGDYERALEYYDEAGDKAALDRLAADLLARGEYELFFRCRRGAGKKTMLREEFKDNSRGWNVRNDKYVNSSIADGRLMIEKIAEGTSYLWTGCKLNPDLDFRIQVLITKKSGLDNHAFSIAWGVKDADDNFQFGFSGDGHYRYSCVEDGDWDSRIAWTESDAVNKGNADNLIAVEKQGGTLHFFINGERVNGWMFEGLPGDRVAVSIIPKSVIEVRSFTVEEYPSARGPWGEISDQALTRTDYPAALKYAFLAGGWDRLRSVAVTCVQAGRTEAVRAALKEAGLSERASRIRLASYMKEADKPREAVAELAKAGWDLSKGFVFPRVREDFKDNSREWSTKETESAKTAIRGGKYFFEKLKTGGSYITWNNFDLSPDADFRVGASIRKISGADDQTYSILWGFDNTDNARDFGVMGSGKIQCGYFTNDKWTSLISATPSAAVRSGNAENLLAVDREGDVLRLLVNGTEVGRAASPELTGGKVGFALYQKMAVEIDNLDVVEYAPPFALALARDVVFSADPAGYSRLAAAMYMDRMGLSKALEAYLAAGDSKGAAACYEALAAQAEAAGDPAAAVEYYVKSGNDAKIRALALKAAAKAAADENWEKALELYGKTAEGEETFKGLAAAYAGLGKKTDAEAAREKLADWYYANSEPEKALAEYLSLSQPAKLDAAGGRYFTAKDFDSAARLFKASGNTRREKDSYKASAAELDKAGDLEEAIDLYDLAGDAAAAKSARNRLADSLAEEGAPEEALELYKKAGNTVKAAALEKKLSAVTGLGGKSAQAGEMVPLNAKVGIVGVAENVTAANVRDRRVTISGVDRSAVRKTEDDRMVTFTIRLKDAMPDNAIPALYFDFTDEFVLFMFDKKNEFRASSETGNFSVSWKEEGTAGIGFRRVDAKTIQCDIGLIGRHYDTGSYRTVTDFDLTGKRCTLTVFIMEAADVWGFVPMGSAKAERESYAAISNVFQTKVSF